MINALFSSKDGGTKQFSRDNSCTFGWKSITDLYKRELARASNNQARMVPRLREAHCLRDAWTKLNVLPAKIMQVKQAMFNSFTCLNNLYSKNKYLGNSIGIYIKIPHLLMLQQHQRLWHIWRLAIYYLSKDFCLMSG